MFEKNKSVTSQPLVPPTVDADFIIQVATADHFQFAQIIVDEMESSAKLRGTGIAKRSPEYIKEKMAEGKAVIALSHDNVWGGFCYIETWGHGEYVANSGLIVSPNFRQSGLAKRIKEKVFELSRKKYPEAKIFGLTTGLAVMKINSDLGYRPVTYSELTDDDAFWAGCKSCINYEILTMKERKNCLCTAMLYDPAQENKQKKEEPKQKESPDNLVKEEGSVEFVKSGGILEKLMLFKKQVLTGNPSKFSLKFFLANLL
ncbi:N-acetyltransferase [Adhaeribacter aquaticus]|uniref:N-acetyltransferase n=1 Tax=Adhaeribacter aquaticus TaxID=299567 RepID=UPI000416F056|nr:N-acetyltransferase [Adhaeribacter aquaticus]